VKEKEEKNDDCLWLCPFFEEGWRTDSGRRKKKNPPNVVGKKKGTAYFHCWQGKRGVECWIHPRKERKESGMPVVEGGKKKRGKANPDHQNHGKKSPVGNPAQSGRREKKERKESFKPSGRKRGGGGRVPIVVWPLKNFQKRFPGGEKEKGGGFRSSVGGGRKKKKKESERTVGRIRTTAAKEGKKGKKGNFITLLPSE